MKILVSACLYGEACRYDGKSCACCDKHFLDLKEKGVLVPVCPEVLGGLDTPRNPCEIIGERVISKNGDDCTEKYLHGAKRTLEIAEKVKPDFCILKSKSPSCGTGKIYDGSFSGKLTDGNGITARLLISHGYRVYDENDIPEILKLYVR